jgi:hypothetical protein
MSKNLHLGPVSGTSGDIIFGPPCHWAGARFISLKYAKLAKSEKKISMSILDLSRPSRKK